MANCAITGSTGFIGKSLVPYLLKEGLSCKPILRQEIAVIDKQHFYNCETIVHLAGKAHDLKNVTDHAEYYEVNFKLTKQAFDAFLQSEASKFIFISTVKACADKVSGILTEDEIPNPQTHYGKSKLMAEQYIQSQPLPYGKSYYILRPCLVYGHGIKGNLKLLCQLVKKGLPYPLARFNNKRSFVSVNNLCFIIGEIIKSDGISTGVYHIADDESLSTNELIAIMAKAINKKPVLWHVSPRLVKLLAKVGDTFKLPFTTERLLKLTESYVVSNTKIKQAINKPLPLTIHHGMASFCS